MEKSYKRRLSALAIAAMMVGCNSVASISHGNTGGSGGPTTNPSGSDGGAGGSGGTGGGGGGTGGNGAVGPAGGPPCTNMPADVDSDGDGYTPAQGDCNDCDPAINPGAIEIRGNGLDDDCNGSIDDTPTACDTGATGKSDTTSLAESIELCDKRFLKGSVMPAPRTRARATSWPTSAP